MTPSAANDRTPVIVGAAQTIQRPGDWTDPNDARGPIDLMVAAARDAAADAGASELLKRIDFIAVVGGFWSYRNPGRLIADQLGANHARSALTAISGSSPQDAVGLAAQRIADGELDVALVVGGEARWSQRQLRTLGVSQPREAADGAGDAEAIGGFPVEMIDEARELGSAATAYALFEDSLRNASGASVSDHRTKISRLWSQFNAVAVDNAFAWDRERRGPDDIREPSAKNRIISFPYTVAMVANNTVDMASAVLMCSAATAREMGVTSDRMVYPQVSVHGHETWRIVQRDVLHQLPVLTAMAHAARDRLGIELNAAAHLDLYACFPAIVQMSSEALGIDINRTLTLTGGLGFAGAPVANSSGQALAAMIPEVRHGGYGVLHANGGNATKHALGVYANTPPRQPFRRLDVRGESPVRAGIAPEQSISGDVEAATVAFDRNGPTHVVAAIRDHHDGRGIATSTDPDLIAEVMASGIAGERWPLDGTMKGLAQRGS